MYTNIEKKYSCSKVFSSINDWIIKTRKRENKLFIGFLSAKGSDFQNQDYIYVINSKTQLPHPRGTNVSSDNLLEIAIYFAVRHSIDHCWLNHDDQFSFPNELWKNDIEFHIDSLIYTLFHRQNRISSEHGINHWIPFAEEEVDAKEKFESHFMSDYLKGKRKMETSQKIIEGDLFFSQYTPKESIDGIQLQLSEEAKSVMDAGRELWRYYHQQPIAKERPNASLYDIRLYFQGTKTTKSGKVQMNTESEDTKYTALITVLRNKLKLLASKIEPKVYEYGFLKK